MTCIAHRDHQPLLTTHRRCCGVRCVYLLSLLLCMCVPVMYVLHYSLFQMISIQYLYTNTSTEITRYWLSCGDECGDPNQRDASIKVKDDDLLHGSGCLVSGYGEMQQLQTLWSRVVGRQQDTAAGFRNISHHSSACNVTIDVGSNDSSISNSTDVSCAKTKDVQLSCGGEIADDLQDILKSYERFTDKSTKIPKWKSMSYRSFPVTHECTPVKHQCTYMLSLQELYRGVPTQGGSIFRAILSAKSDRAVLLQETGLEEEPSEQQPQNAQYTLKTYCPIQDHSDGTYTIHCVVPTAVDVKHFTLEVYMEFLNYSGYDQHAKIGSTNKRVMKQEMITAHSTTALRSDEECRDVAYNHHAGMWLAVTAPSSLHWLTRGCIMQLYTHSHIHHCVKREYDSRFLFMGDSHTRFTYTYFIDVLGKMIPDLHPRFQRHLLIDQMQFMWSPYIDNAVRDLQLIMQQVANGSREMPGFIVIGSGSWDLHFQGLQPLLRNSFKFINYIKQLHAAGSLEKTKLIWLELVAFPDVQKPNPKKRNFRNNGSIAAVNAWFRHHLRKVGNVVTINTLPMSIPMQDKVICGAHYLCDDPLDKTDRYLHVRGDVGIHIVNLLLREICPLYML